MKFAFIDAEKASFPISQMCRVPGVSQSGFFAWHERPACRRRQQDMVCLAHIRTAFALSHGTCGSPRMHRDLVDEGHEIGRHRTARLMRENQLIARQKRRFKRTTDSEHAWPVAPNLVAQDFSADGPDRKWGADISYIWTAELQVAGFGIAPETGYPISRNFIECPTQVKIPDDLGRAEFIAARGSSEPPASQSCRLDHDPGEIGMFTAANTGGLGLERQMRGQQCQTSGQCTGPGHAASCFKARRASSRAPNSGRM